MAPFKHSILLLKLNKFPITQKAAAIIFRYMNENKQILKSYQISTSPQEIMDVLKRNRTEDNSIMWQSFPEFRKVYNFYRFGLDLFRKKIVITSDLAVQEIQKDRPIYVKLSFRESVFKGTILEMNQNELTLDIPKEIHVREFRESLRSVFVPGTKFVDLRPSMNASAFDRMPSLKVSLRDISAKGLGLIVSESNMHLFREGQLIDMMGTGGELLDSPIGGIVAHTHKQAKVGHEKGIFYRVGIKMLSVIPEAVLNKFNDTVEVKRSVSQQLFNTDIFSEQFKIEMAEEMEKAIEKLRQKPSISKYFSQLEILRGQDDYIEEHIKVLTIICTFIARSLGWVSDASTEKFVYASYIHDAPLFQNPKLARIRNRKEFDRMKLQLSQEEQDLFLSAPIVASQIAAADTGAPPDAHQMLLMQKELPDGSGFPNQYSAIKIGPMASLFIVAHDISDDIMNDPNWTMDKWLQKGRRLYRGNHFNKIMDSLESVKVSLKKPKSA